MLFAMGAGPRVIGVSNFDKYPPEALTRTKVGGLIDPDVERIISLKPDLVVVYGTQDDLRMQLERAKIPMFLYQHAGLQDITATIRQLGARIGSEKESECACRPHRGGDCRRQKACRRTAAASYAARIRTRRRNASRHLRERRRRISCRHARGGGRGECVCRRQTPKHSDDERACGSPRARGHHRNRRRHGERGRRNLRAWESLPSVPAVRNKRIYQLRGDGMMNPGPRVSTSVRRVAEVLHPEAFGSKSNRESRTSLNNYENCYGCVFADVS